VDERGRDAGGLRDPRDPHVVHPVSGDQLARDVEDALATAARPPSRAR
jgi:hypothetical protein